jgi:Cu(I)/Ag(I) efflux system membrane fusion protein
MPSTSRPNALARMGLAVLFLLPAALTDADPAGGGRLTPDDPVLLYRDPMGGPELSATPKKDAMGMDYLPVRASELAGRLPALDGAPPTPSVKRVLYYRNPMGLADVSPTPRKDAMGMDYVPVYDSDERDVSVIKLSPGKAQRIGVRSEPARLASLAAKVRVPGAIQLDERRVTVVATRATAFLEKVANVTTGDKITKGQTLLRFYSQDIVSAAAEYASNPSFEGARSRLDVLNAPEDYIAEVARTRKAPRSIVWPAPQSGIILERNAIEGAKADPGQQLFKIADLSVIWALVDVPERDYPRIALGQPVTLTARGMPERAFLGRVSLIYPQINRDSRTARVRVELQNPDLILRPDMYVEAEIDVTEAGKVLVVPESAVLDSGARKIVLLDLGEGRFAPRDIAIGRRGLGLVEIRDGLSEGDKVVTSANFLIDSESNLKAALQSLAPQETTNGGAKP